MDAWTCQEGDVNSDGADDGRNVSGAGATIDADSLSYQAG